MKSSFHVLFIGYPHGWGDRTTPGRHRPGKWPTHLNATFPHRLGGGYVKPHILHRRNVPPPYFVATKCQKWEIGPDRSGVIRPARGTKQFFFPWVLRSSDHICLPKNSAPAPRYGFAMLGTSGKKRPIREPENLYFLKFFFDKN